jgi:hypothetical protein
MEENVQKGCQYTCVIYNDTGTNILLAGNDGYIRQVVSGSTISEIPHGSDKIITVLIL